MAFDREVGEFTVDEMSGKKSVDASTGWIDVNLPSPPLGSDMV